MTSTVSGAQQPIGKSSLRSRWLYRTPFRYRWNSWLGQLGSKLVRYAARDSNMLSYAADEWKIAFPEPDDMQDAVRENVLDVVAVFSLAHHSGMTAGYSIGLIERVLRFDPLSPLTGADDEWTQVGFDEDFALYQNKRCSSVFKNTFNGEAYDIDASPIYQYPDGCSFTKGGTRDYIEFPYTPGAVPRPIIMVDEDGEEIPVEDKLSAAREIVKRFYPEMKPDYSGRRVQIALAAMENSR